MNDHINPESVNGRVQPLKESFRRRLDNRSHTAKDGILNDDRLQLKA